MSKKGGPASRPASARKLPQRQESGRWQRPARTGFKATYLWASSRCSFVTMCTEPKRRPPRALVFVWRSCDRRVRINQLRSVSREELTYLIGGHGPGEQVPLTEITAEILQRAQLPFGLDPFGDGN